MGSISGLISILLLVDLCTCRISDQNQKKKYILKIIYSKRIFLVYIVLDLTSFMAPLPGI